MVFLLNKFKSKSNVQQWLAYEAFIIMNILQLLLFLQAAASGSAFTKSVRRRHNHKANSLFPILCTSGFYNQPPRTIKAPKLTESDEWRSLEKHAAAFPTSSMQDPTSKTHLKNLLTDEARTSYMSAIYEGIYLDYSRQRVTMDTMKLLFKLAEKQNLRQRISDMFGGQKINFTEKRAVLHTALRAPRDHKNRENLDEEIHEEVHEVLDKIKLFTSRVRR